MTRRILLVLAAAACHNIPNVPEVRIVPQDANTSHDLKAEVVDPKEGESYSYTWYRNGDLVPGQTNDVVRASLTERDDTWRVDVTAFLKDERSAFGKATAVIQNHAPVVTLAMAPQEPAAGDALVVAVVPWDADGDPITLRYKWTRNDVHLTEYTGDTVAADSTSRGEVWACEVTASDPFESGPTSREEVEVSNGRPVVTNARITPESPHSWQPLTVTANVRDPDGDAFTVRYAWSVNGTVVQDRKGATLHNDWFVTGDRVTASVVATDLGGDGEALVVGPIQIENAAPGAPVVTVSPVDAVQGQPLQCRVKTAPSDPDGDEIVAYSASWTVDGKSFLNSATTNIPGDTVPAKTTQGDETWQCLLRASDGQDWGPGGADAVDVEFPGWRESQVIGGRTVTCDTATHTSGYTVCTGLRVEGKALGNGVDCYKTWVSEQDDSRHDLLCDQVTGSTAYWAHYKCAGSETRTTYHGGASWGSITDAGFTESLRCGW